MADEREGADNNNINDDMGNQLQLLPGECSLNSITNQTKRWHTSEGKKINTKPQFVCCADFSEAIQLIRVTLINPD